MTNVTIMHIQIKYVLHFLIWLAFTTIPLTLAAAELTGRFSMLGSTAQATQGDIGFITKNNILSADQQSLRLMLDHAQDDAEWSLHLKTVRQHLSDIPFSDRHSSDLFRWSKQSAYWINETEANNSTHLGYELDRAVYKHRFNNVTLALGRQPVDWGSGRFWQPLNIFGAFAPTDLDTDFKPGIDSIKLDWFPSSFSSLSTVYALAPHDNVTLKNKNSAGIYYKRQVATASELSLLAGSVIGNAVFGAAFESSWAGMGWRVEAMHSHLTTTDENSLFWIAGLDYQFENGTLLSAEWYENSRGATNINMLGNLQSDTLVLYGLQQHLSKNILGLSISKEMTPLLNAAYTLLASPLKDGDQFNTSLLHQLNFTYSVSNESDLLFSLQVANGRGLNTVSKPQSEFGHLPVSLSVRLRFYF